MWQTWRLYEIRMQIGNLNFGFPQMPFLTLVSGDGLILESSVFNGSPGMNGYAYMSKLRQISFSSSLLVQLHSKQTTLTSPRIPLRTGHHPTSTIIFYINIKQPCPPPPAPKRDSRNSNSTITRVKIPTSASSVDGRGIAKVIHGDVSDGGGGGRGDERRVRRRRDGRRRRILRTRAHGRHSASFARVMMKVC